MSMFNNNPLQRYFAVDDASGQSNQALSKEDIVNILNEEEPDHEEDEIQISDKGDGPAKPDKKVGEKKEATPQDKGKGDSSDDEGDGESGEEPDEYEDLEEELKVGESDEDELELITPVRRKEILAKYPTIFKDFPYLEKAYYREQQFSEVFSSLDDARRASEDSQVLRAFEQQFYAGDISELVSELKKENQNSFHKFVDNYLPTLQKVDQQAFVHVVNSVVKPLIYNMVQQGAQSNDEELVAAARKLNQFFYGSARYEPHQPLSKQVDNKESEAENKIAAERQALFTERFGEARTKLTERVDTGFKRVIEKNIDPKGDMSDYVKRTAMREAHEKLSDILSKDTRFRSILDKAWRQAGQSNFSPDSMEKIRRIINSRAQTVLPSVIKMARNEALRGIGKRVRVTKDNDDDNSGESGRSASSKNRGPLRESSRNGQGGSSKQLEIPKGMSNKDFIMSD